jgi:lantibiotic modifying enzyme
MHDTGSFIDIAYQIGLHLCREAIWSDGRCNWLGASAERIFDRPYIVQRTFGSDIYGGTSGIALFLGHLYSYTRDAICKKTALAAMRQAVSATHKIENDFSLGLFTGVAGVAYVQLRLGILLEEPEWVSRGLVLLKQLPKDPTNIAYRDVVMGAAGAIAVLLAAGHRFQDASFIEEAQAFGEDLLRSACDTGKGWSWRTFGVLDGGQNLTGFSHGTSGIAWSLLELYNAVSDRRFLRAALEAFSYEGRLFDPSQRNWPDLRYAGSKNGDNARQMNFATAWCHGAPGIGLSRIVAIEVTADEKFKEQLRTALGTTSPTISQYAPDREAGDSHLESP